MKKLPTDRTPVVDAYEHALLARYPAPRYTCGDRVSLFRFLSVAPEWLSDAVLRRLQLELKPTLRTQESTSDVPRTESR